MKDTLRIQSVQPPVIPIIADLIRQYPGTISLGQGVVGYAPPGEAAEALASFWADPENHKYQAVGGIPPLLEMLKEKLRNENGINVGPQTRTRIIVTAGANMAFLNAVLAVADPGDEIILQKPFYFNYEMAIVLAGCKPVIVDTDASYQIDPAAIRRAVTSKTRAIVTISPNNPTGAVYPKAPLREIGELCLSRGLYHIHDEAYEYFVYDGSEHFSPGRDFPRTISLFSLSKAFGFAGWRIGYMVIPEELADAVEKIQDTNLICPPVASQYAACGALRAGASWAREKVRSIAEVRSIVWRSLASIQHLCEIPRTQGAFYFFLRVQTKLKAMTLVERLIQKYRVAVIPGSAFGIHDRTTLRLSYGALTVKSAEEGVGRLCDGLHELAGTL